MFLSEVNNRASTYWRTPESGEGAAAGTSAFAGWVAVKWTFPVYPGIFAELKERVKRERQKMKITICEIVMVTSTRT